MSADTGAVDAAVINIMAFAMKGAVLGGGDEAWEVVVAKYPTVAESYREMARAAYTAFQRANAERVTALVDELIEKANADHTEHEAVLYWNGNDRDEIERHAALSSRIDTLNEVKALLKTVVGEVGM